MEHKLDKWDLLIEEAGYKFNGQSNIDVDKETSIEKETNDDSMVELMNDLGISMSDEPTYNLIIWNDNFNDMLYVVLTLQEICKLSSADSLHVMTKAHENGKAIAKSGSLEEMNNMKRSLNLKGLEATVEK